MSKQPEDKPPIEFNHITLEIGLFGTPRRLTLETQFEPSAQLAHQGDHVTMRLPDGATYETECLSVQIGKGLAGEYAETCELGPVKFVPSEHPA